jgi:hypothetical protein
MPAETPPPPRRNWHLARWFLVFAIATFGWSGWRAYAFRSALAEAKALGWFVEYTDPVEDISRNWQDAFKKRTWTDGVKVVSIPRSESFEQNLATIRRLNPSRLDIFYTARLPHLSSFKGITRLRWLSLENCQGLTEESVGALQAALPHMIVNAQP